MKDIGWNSKKAPPLEARVSEGQLREWMDEQNELARLDTYAMKPQLTFRVTYDNGQVVEVMGADKFEASAEADEILVAKGFDLDDLMFSPTVEAV